MKNVRNVILLQRAVFPKKSSCSLRPNNTRMQRGLHCSCFLILFWVGQDFVTDQGRPVENVSFGVLDLVKLLDHCWNPLYMKKKKKKTRLTKRLHCPCNVILLYLKLRETWFLSCFLYCLAQVCYGLFLWNLFLWNLTAGIQQSILKHLHSIWNPNFSCVSPSLLYKMLI